MNFIEICTRRPAPITLLMGLCLWIGGCVSVPLTTIVRMSTFDEQDFAQLDAQTLRVRITLPQGYALNAAASTLGVDIKSAAGEHQSSFELEQERADVVRVSMGWLAGDTPGTAYVLRLTPASGAKLKTLQQFVSRGRPGDITINIAPKLSAFSEHDETVKVWIDLRLAQAQDYFTLIDGAEIPLEQIREFSRPPAPSAPAKSGYP